MHREPTRTRDPARSPSPQSTCQTCVLSGTIRLEVLGGQASRSGGHSKRPGRSPCWGEARIVSRSACCSSKAGCPGIGREEPGHPAPLYGSTRRRDSRYANATVLAPEITSSTTFAAPTIVEPFSSCSSVIPRGLVHAPHSHTWPPLSTNSRYSSASTGKPGCAVPSAPPSVPTHTASIVQSTIDSCPAAAAMFAATNGRVARSASSLPWVQLKISLSLISSSPFHAHQESSIARSLDGTNNVAHHPSEGRQVLLRRRILCAHHEHVADRDLLHPPAELAGEAVGAPEISRVEVMDPARLRGGDRPEA